MRIPLAIALLLLSTTPIFPQQTMGGTGTTAGTGNMGFAVMAAVPSYTGQTCSQYINSGSSTSCSLLTNAGDTLLIFNGYANGLTTTNSLTCGTATYPRPATIWNGGNSANLFAYAVNVSASSSCTVTANYSASSSYPGITVYGFHANTAAPLDESSCGSSNSYCATTGGSTPDVSNAITTAGSNEIVLSFFNYANSGNASTSTAGYTLINPTSTNTAAAYALQSSAGSYFVTWNGNSGGSFFIIVNVAIKA